MSSSFLLTHDVVIAQDAAFLLAKLALPSIDDSPEFSALGISLYTDLVA